MSTRNVVLTQYHEALIGSLVQSGPYQHACAVLHEGWRLIERRELADQALLTARRAAVAAGLDG